ncbi:MAG: tetratricopeptide repeat protein [Chloroflexaceae bacterium]|nr:tetratricopeptide repeat protein [Chloroflexaceae bacterium]
MHALVRWRSEVLFLIALVIFAATVLWRSLQPPAPAFDLPQRNPRPFEAANTGNPATIGQLQDYLRANPDDTTAYATLGLSLLQQVRETSDPILYTQAEQAFAEALTRDPQHFEALVGQGMLALSRHQFTEALAWGEQARSVNPHNAQPYGILGDAYTELGQYPEAAAAIQQMVDVRPDVRSYSRVSYQRELHGDVAGAIEAMERAARAGNPNAEETLWARVQLGHLYFNSGDLARAEAEYIHALETRADYVPAFAGVARVRAAQGNTTEAIEFYTLIVDRLPLPEYAIALGDLYTVSGDTTSAEQQYKLVHTIQQLNKNAGMNTDLEMALFLADYGDSPTEAVQQARAAYAQRPSIHAADVLAWALYQQGHYAEAWQYSQEALRLGTRDALFHFHAGMIAAALDDTAAAHHHLQQALAINPHFSVRYAPQATAQLEQLAASKGATE